MTTVAKISAAAQMVRIIQRLNGYSSRLYAFDRNRFQQRHASEWTSVSLVDVPDADQANPVRQRGASFTPKRKRVLAQTFAGVHPHVETNEASGYQG